MKTEAPPEAVATMGRKKGERETTLARIYADFYDKVQQAAGERRATVAEFCDRFLTPCVEKAHRDYIRAEAKKLAKDDRGEAE